MIRPALATLRWLLLACALLTLAACGPRQVHWQLDNVTGVMPDLAFDMTDTNGQAVTAQDYRGKVVVMYFGYAHCPDVCPLTMANLHAVLQGLGEKTASHIQVLFVTVDPARDTVPFLHEYLDAFDTRFVGLRGTPSQLQALVKRYRGIYEIEKPIPANGNYAVSHSSGIYIFGPQGKIRLLASESSSIADMTHDLRILVQQGAS